MTQSLVAALAGLRLGLGLIVAIGAQNAFVLRQGLRREHVGLVVAFCAACDLALIAVVGRGMKSTRGTAGRIFSALAHANVNVKMIDQGSSELNIIIGVANDDFAAAIRAIYNIFVIAQL